MKTKLRAVKAATALEPNPERAERTLRFLAENPELAAKFIAPLSSEGALISGALHDVADELQETWLLFCEANGADINTYVAMIGRAAARLKVLAEILDGVK